MTCALFIFAHQDDEVAVLPRIRSEVERGSAVHCLFLTDGGAKGVQPEIRNAESRGVLTRLGVDPQNIHFLGSIHHTHDQHLHDRLEETLPLVMQIVGGLTVHRIYTLAWEGGHPDHDAAHLVALAVGHAIGAPEEVWEYPFYNGDHLPWRFFRVMRLIPNGRPRLEERRGRTESLRDALACTNYRSQRLSWLGLVWEASFRRYLLRQNVVQQADAQRTLRPPHSGRLLYERMYGIRYLDFARVVAPFIAGHIPTARDNASETASTGNASSVQVNRPRPMESAIDNAGNQLATEADYIHRSLFGRAAPNDVINRYVSAHEHYCSSDRENESLRRIVGQQLDLEAIEFASRRPASPLTRKIHIVLFLIEARSEYQKSLMNEETTNPVVAFCSLGFATFRSAYKLVKGKYLIRRYELV